MFESRSALAGYGAERVAGANGDFGALRLGEAPGTPLVHVGIYPGARERVAAQVATVLGGAIPDSPVQAVTAGVHLMMRIAPDQYWILGGAPELDGVLRAAISPENASITSLDGARTRLIIEGPRARALLAGLVAIDLQPAAFPVHGFAQTGIHHVGGLLLRVSEDRYDFFALRTFAASTWEVLLDAARPFGYEIVHERMK